ncbi:hypothetical protein Nepgr_012057 [Nepenthes gracilis]|uniref:Pentatricopeptide repeat-containing protein n=1 Tax=Nepenthes gracilis TaxID=150966 RepID=A0AAD3XMX6_NEPGR|nr:hypothetical protein Nepgr_012057 [Nepenthes gracilis]
MRRCTSLPSPCSLSEPRSSASIKTLLNLCKTLRTLEQIHAQIIQKGLEDDNSIVCSFVSLCNSLSVLRYATSVFHRVSNPSLVPLWNSILKGHCDHSSLALSLTLFSRMRLHPVAPDNYTLPALIKCCSHESAICVGKGIHGLTIKYGVVDEVAVGSSLIGLYGKCGKICHARNVFDEMSVKNEVSWNVMIVAYVNFGDMVEARRVFDIMPVRNVVSWNAMIDRYAKFGNLKNARKLFDEMPEKNVISYTSMIDGYAKRGDMASARFLFEHCQQRDVILWSALISGYTQNGLPNEAVKMFFEMKSTNVRPDEFIMVSLMSACSHIGHLQLAKWTDSYMNMSCFDLHNTHVAAALVDMNAKCGNMERAIRLFNNMPKRDLVSYCSMIQGLSVHGQGEKAVGLFYKMLSEGLTPDDVAFTVILTTCSRAGLVEEGYGLFDLMRKGYSIVPSPDHYACMVDLLGRSGQLKAAYDLIKSMPIEPHAGTWGALLGACKLHYDIEFGEIVAARLKELEPCNSGTYVLLSNIYAAANRWFDVSIFLGSFGSYILSSITTKWHWVSPFSLLDDYHASEDDDLELSSLYHATWIVPSIMHEVHAWWQASMEKEMATLEQITHGS